jgi:predicted transcriptional regulator
MKKRNGIMTFRLPDEEKAKLQGFAEQADCTLSDLAVKAVRDLIASLEAASAPALKAPAKKKKA